MGNYCGKNINTYSSRSYKGKTLICLITNVVDGDTIDVITRLPHEPSYKVRLRIYGIDTPENAIHGANKPSELEINAGLLVKKIVSEYVELMPYAKVEFLKPDKYYGREIAKVYLGNYNFFGQFIQKINLASVLIKRNLALPYDGKTKYDFTNQFLQNIIKNNK